MTSDTADGEEREIDPAVFDLLPIIRRPPGRPARPTWMPSAQERRESAVRAERARASDAAAALYYGHAGDAPFTVQTILTMASNFPELWAQLLVIAPDRVGLGVPSRNMLTRWFTDQEVAPSGPNSRFQIERLGPTAVWRYRPLEVAEF